VPPERIADVEEWLEFQAQTLAPALLQLPQDSTAANIALKKIEAAVSKRDFLVGDSVTAADISIGCQLLATSDTPDAVKMYAEVCTCITEFAGAISQRSQVHFVDTFPSDASAHPHTVSPFGVTVKHRVQCDLLNATSICLSPLVSFKPDTPHWLGPYVPTPTPTNKQQTPTSKLGTNLPLLVTGTASH
jgi:hypothetical protein